MGGKKPSIDTLVKLVFKLSDQQRTLAIQTSLCFAMIIAYHEGKDREAEDLLSRIQEVRGDGFILTDDQNGKSGSKPTSENQ